MQLKEENSRLKELAPKVQEVEKLKYENKVMRIELQKLRAPSLTDGFANSQNFKQQALTNHEGSLKSIKDRDNSMLGLGYINDSQEYGKELPPI